MSALAWVAVGLGVLFLLGFLLVLWSALAIAKQADREEEERRHWGQPRLP